MLLILPFLNHPVETGTGSSLTPGQRCVREQLVLVPSL